MRTAVRWKALAGVAMCLAGAACGQKGPPLPPLHLVPAAVTDVSVRRVEDRVRLRFVLPSKNANGPGPVDLDHVDIFAMTMPPGAGTPANRVLLERARLVGQVAVRPAPVEGQEPREGDTRPEPGATVTFDEQLTPASLTPVEVKLPPAKPAGPAGPASAPPPDKPAGPAAAAGAPPAAGTAASGSVAPTQAPPAKAAAGPAHPVRVYVLRGVTRSGRPGEPSTRAALPLVELPPPPSDVAARFTEKAVLLEWTPPGADPPVAFNVYSADDPVQPINPTPVPAPPFEHAGAKFGVEVCLAVRSARVSQNVAIEGPLSEARCVTPRDIFPPAAPQGLAAVPTPGQISLIWNANGEPDLAGYLVLRADAGGGSLTALTPAPIRETSYRDNSVTPGVRYIYAVVAVDSASPPNSSEQSARVEETAR